MMKFVIVLLLSLLIVLISASIDSNVNDAKAAISNEYLTIMKFYSPMCGGCMEIGIIIAIIIVIIIVIIIIIIISTRMGRSSKSI